MPFSTFSRNISILLLLAGTPALSQEWYPTIDGGSYWEVGSFGYGTLSNVCKKIKTNASQTENRKIFYSLSFDRLSVGSTNYYVTPQCEYTNEVGDIKQYYGWYSVGGTNWVIYICYQFSKSGYFAIITNWWTPYPSNQGDFKFVFQADYDLGIPGSLPQEDDIVEYVLKENNVDQWYAPVTNPTSVSYSGVDAYPPGHLDGNFFARCVDATSASTQLMLLWGAYAGTQCVQGLTFINLSVVSPLQTIGDHVDYQQYAYAGADQMVEISLSINSALPDPNPFRGIAGMVFQKPNGRSLLINTYVMEGAWTPDLNLTVDAGRSVAMALNELTLSRWTNSTKTNLPNPYKTRIWNWGWHTRQVMSYAQLHDFMINSRNASPETGTTAMQYNMRDWKVEMDVVDNWFEYEGNGIAGLIFDYGDNDNNHIQREASALSWPCCNAYIPSGWNAQRWAAFVFIHEMGHCFNLQHTWSDCGIYYNSTDCPTANRTIMSYGPIHGSTTMTWSANNLNWYQNAPESWAKPGKYGTLWHGVNCTDHPDYCLNPPYFSPY